MLQHVVKAGMEELRVEFGMKDRFKEKLLKSRLKRAALWKEWEMVNWQRAVGHKVNENGKPGRWIFRWEEINYVQI